MHALNEDQSLWITEEQLGSVQTLKHRGRSVQYRLPKEIERKVTLRFRGYGRSQNNEQGDLLLHVQVDRGQDLEAVLWLSEREARAGAQKNLLHRKQLAGITVPAASADRQVVRVKGLGGKSPFHWGLPLFGRRRGDLLVKLRVFPDRVVVSYRSVDCLGTEDLALESWIYRRTDFILEKVGQDPFSLAPITAEDVADLFNERGWLGLARHLAARLNLGAVPISFEESGSLPVPGQCQKQVVSRNGGSRTAPHFTIILHSRFADDPFAATAILGHELCHVLEASILAEDPAAAPPQGAALTEMERTVDLLMFFFGLGEFQMRVARERRLTLGYFNQELFERMQVIFSRKRTAAQASR
jgi:hypothetical protein